MPLARSRYRGGIGSIGQTFSQTPTSCPPGQHYVAPAASSVRGVELGACVPNTIIPLTLRPPPPPPPNAPLMIQPLTFRQPTSTAAPAPTVTAAPAPSTGGDAAAAPAPSTVLCPPLWPWWWILVAGVVGFGGGYYYEQNKKKVRRNAGRYASRIVNRAGDVAIARLIG